jgi:cyclophilin family peptidyl-prolyl cis-trans isomerase
MALNERDPLLSSNPVLLNLLPSNPLSSKLQGRKWLRALIGRVLSDYDSRGSRRINFEPLESRQLMASDFFDSASMAADHLPFAATTNSYAYYSQLSSLQAEGEGDAGEGEDAPNLVEFAKALTQAGVRFFGADWCPICTQQKELFEDGQVYLPFLEMTNPDRTRNATAISENVTQYPTWEFGNGSRATGLQTLQQLSTLSGVAIPAGSNPTFVEIPNQTVLNGAPLHVPVDAYDPNGGPLTITVQSSNPSVITAEMIGNPKSLRLDVNGYGEMVFRLFADEAPRPVGRIETLVNSGFYNQTASNKIIFHRVIDNFVLQAGDPTGTGSGGSTLPDFDDQFDFDLQHVRTGILSYAKSSDDTNDSQFFITEGPQRHLDFNHSIFGQLVEGDSNREGISRTQVSSSRPVNEVSINSAEIFNDTQNGLIRLKALASSGTSTITVTVQDSTGLTFSRQFTATAAADTANGGPFLSDITVPASIVAGQETTLQLTGNDVEGDPVFFDATRRGSVNYQFTMDDATGLLRLTPPANYTGPLEISVGVRARSGTPTTQDTFDTQILTFNVVAANNLAAPTGIDLASVSDSGSSNSDNLTNAGSMQFVVSGTAAGATVNLRVGSTIVGTAVATGTSTTITTALVAQLGQGTHSIVATQTLDNQTSVASPALAVTFDSLTPIAIGNSFLPTSANVGTALSVDLAHPEEGQGLRYTLENAPVGLTIDANTGVMTWTPTAEQIGARTAELRLTDAAGNTQSQQLSIAVADSARVSVQLLPFDFNGNALSSLSVNQEFNLRVVVNDLRNTGDAEGDGVFSAYMDINYDPALVEVVGTTPVTYNSNFGNGRAIPILTTPGLIDEFGAFSSFTAGPGRDPQIVGVIRMRAKASGQAVFTADQAENPSRGFSVFKLDGAIPSNRINFIANNVAIGRNFVVTNDTFNFNEDTSNNNLTVLANDTITPGSGAVLTIQSVGTTSNGGTVSITSDNQRLTYSPAANFNGQETFTYTVRDQTGATSSGTVTVQVNPVNDNPVAVNDTVTTVRSGDQDVFVNVLANDHSGPDTGETLVVTQVGTPSQGGTVRVATSGTGVVYTPRVGFTGNETFTYTISDGLGGTATATATMVVGPAVPPPTVVNDSFNVQEDAAAATFDPLANDTPAATGDTLTITSVQAPNGTATITTDGTRISYAPRANANGTELVIYTARSTNGGSAVGTITFNIAAVNDPPDAVNDTFDVLSQPNQTVDVLANDINVDSGETLVITAVTQPPSGQGTVQIGPNGRTLTYSAPTTEFTGTVTFSYTLGDGSTLTDTATVTLNVQNFRPRNVGITLDSPVQGLSVNATFIPSVGGNGSTSQPVVRTSAGVQVNNVGPGEVRFEIPKLPFLVGEAKTVVVQSAFGDSDSLATPVQVGNRHARYVDIRDFMGRNLRNGVTAAVVPNQSAQWFDSQGAWRTYTDVSIAMNSTGSQLTVRGTSPTNQQRETTLPLTDSRVQVRAQEGNASLVRIGGTPDQVFATTTSGTDTALGEGEGESSQNLNAQAVDQAMQQIRSNPSLVPVDDIDTIARNSVSTGFRRGFRTR